VTATYAEFSEWVLGAHRRLLRFAELTSGDPGRAEDLVQDALVRTFAAWPRIRSGNPEAYARRCVVNRRIDWWRRRSSSEESHEHVPFPPGGDFSSSTDQKLVVLAAMHRLTVRERTVVAMRFWLGLPEAEIATELEIAVGTVKSTLARAVKKLRTDANLIEEIHNEHVR
jgi:RNA polymerase sigma-70 factor (sigma-E family)